MAAPPARLDRDYHKAPPTLPAPVAVASYDTAGNTAVAAAAAAAAAVVVVAHTRPEPPGPPIHEDEPAGADNAGSTRSQTKPVVGRVPAQD